ncbi:MAG: type II secretion system protein [Alphaproteobacteria bacterium]
MSDLLSGQQKAHNQKGLDIQGLSILEIAIVLVIIGMLVGAVVAGLGVVRASEYRTILKEAEGYQSAVRMFQGKYSALPGDMPNATDYWGAATCPSTAGTGTQTCNGDGDSFIETTLLAGSYTEMFMFWQHLSIAGLIPGEYTGRSGTTGGGGAGYDHTVGVNHPASDVAHASWWVFNQNISGAGGGVAFRIDYGNFLQIGARTNTVIPNTPFLKPDDAWSVDSKADDGKPGTGRIIARDYNNCATGAASNTDVQNASYNISSGLITCSLHFIKVF